MSELFNVAADGSSLNFRDLITPWIPSAGSSSATGLLVKTTGQFGITGFEISTLTTQDEISEVHTFFKGALTQQLESQDLLPEGAEVSITSISGGAVEYKIEMHLDVGSDVNSFVDQMEVSLSDLSTLSSSVIHESSGSSYPATVLTLLASLSIDSYAPGTHTVSHLLQWYPDWLQQPPVCQNDGKQVRISSFCIYFRCTLQSYSHYSIIVIAALYG